MEFLIVIGVAFGVVTALAANARGRDATAWFFVGLFTGIFGLIAVLVMKDLSGQKKAKTSHADEHKTR
ncbi:hypothetical protein Pan4_42 [Pseudanabaena phage Pan4]|nr:hypothetical protein Pan4_42 [Pseudanabaena phage Pan4]